MFTDSVVLELKAGDGGNGIIAWRREKYIPKGGPCGGNGGVGGSVIIEADAQLYCLESLRHAHFIRAPEGGRGGGSLCHGKNGEDIIVKVPLGTLIRDSESKTLLYDFTEDKEQWVACAGGRGGYGNAHFKSSTHRAPYEWTPGRAGEERKIEFELKLIADVGLVGFPNAGKSTLLSQMAHIELKCAPYPFTTLYPSVAPLSVGWERRVIVADIPGIIKGAHANRGLGLAFLRHVERTRLLLFVIDIAGTEGRDPIDDFLILQEELHAYRPELLEKPKIFALNKVDVAGGAERAALFCTAFSLNPDHCFEISALTGEGVERLATYLKREIGAMDAAVSGELPQAI